MKKFPFMFLLLTLSQPIMAKDETKNYNCEFSSGMGYQKVDISFNKVSGNEFSATMNIEKKDEKIVEKFRSQLKISKGDGIVYLDNKKNSINPFADASYLKFDGIKKVFGFDQLANNLSLSLYSISGPVGNRSSWTTRLTCTSEAPVAQTEVNDKKIYNGSRSEIKSTDTETSSHSTGSSSSAIDK